MTSGDLVERLEAQHENQLPFIVYRKPNELKVTGLLQNSDQIFFTEEFTEQGFVFSPFDNSGRSVLIPLSQSERISCSHWDGLSKNENPKSLVSGDTNQAKEAHIKLVEKGVEAIKSGAFKKVVLSRKEEVTLSNNNPITILNHLLLAYKSAFVYCWYHPKVGLWLGATPETLIKKEGRRFSIMALAGTQNYDGTLEVTWKEKEKQEQQFVTDFIEDQLRPLVETYRISDTETVKAGNLVHLKTMISAQLKPDIILKDVIDGLHPTPAVCGLPKAEAQRFILDNENYNREYYSGFLGELNFETKVAPRSGRRNIENRAYAMKKNSSQLYVNLRCMQIKDKKGIIYIGGGVTESSISEVEWEETVSKSLVIRKVL
ncbi:chorismate-binding protein [Algibacter mikhailovii]|uniref:Chorismate-utilising enzyme C-terminal domain-containing protein n=1 Tax=Algibacter mikhailovii TaxID=425498 RepID=A0A918V4X0_9FLAO|nr:chorismate-binding protein [Algibacter mikhailovii]GGZ71261.1 hypothetical protein GCM10007028_05590 [Algibacter mikhailovii]